MKIIAQKIKQINIMRFLLLQQEVEMNSQYFINNRKLLNAEDFAIESFYEG